MSISRYSLLLSMPVFACVSCYIYGAFPAVHIFRKFFCNRAILLMLVFWLFKGGKRDNLAVVILNVGVFQLCAERFTEGGDIICPQLLLFGLFGVGKPLFARFFCQLIYSFYFFIHKNTPF